MTFQHTGSCQANPNLLSTDQEVSDYMKSTYFPKIAKGDLQHLLSIYTSNASAGSPFDTGDANAITPQFKRLAALHGDVYFQAPRRFFLDARADKQKTWSFRKPHPSLLICKSLNLRARIGQ